nr:MAG TPA: hypothetical protein [Caudoviricetes sp.]
MFLRSEARCLRPSYQPAPTRGLCRGLPHCSGHLRSRG